MLTLTFFALPQVNAVAPGVIVSPGTDQYGSATIEGARKATPLQRCGTPDEVAVMVAFLLAERASSFVTGQTYYIDGGQSLAGDFFTGPEAQPAELSEEEKREEEEEIAELRAKL
jgi:Enoyl-(Acyl carrier protein) reductase